MYVTRAKRNKDQQFRHKAALHGSDSSIREPSLMYVCVWFVQDLIQLKPKIRETFWFTTSAELR